MIIIPILLAFLVIGSVISFFIGLYKVTFQKEDKEFGLKLLINSTIFFIVGYGTCAATLNLIGI